MMAETVPPGAPHVLSAGPLFPALDTKMTPYLLTASDNIEHTRLKQFSMMMWYVH